MDQNRLYTLPALPYDYRDLAPSISEEQLRIHHTKHHQGYVNGANAVFEKLEKARKEGSDPDQKAVAKELSFHIGGFLLHVLYWENLAPAGKGGGGSPGGDLAKQIDKDFGSFERFKKEFIAATNSVEGSGWGALSYCKKTGRLLVMQIEKHNVNVFPGFPLLLVVDAWEHAYYIDYKNDRAKYLENIWNIINWKTVGSRFESAKKA
ncbi:MAG TPA: superoxide dismutase [Methanolinea sp.]|jgi:Fe-Mn family superoxide dismutase|nr:superoxide dismutase [Methanolinea sp.]MDI6898283.1 superoxide dismutase [Methanolinea sp.]HOS81171.1 superoxide dismutase [Methanolinea sp.]HPC54765.1 superoxide dismutase [Methanolinea sp.]HQE84878.1 superoxide dismutase [Methanolinea sp.]